MTTKHTPGPWMADGAQVTANGAQEINVAWANGYRVDLATVHANARLIAAAPDLLESAKAVTSMLELFLDEISVREKAEGRDLQAAEGLARLEALRAAIAKAEGEQA